MDISGTIAVAISLFALGWNVYRDCINIGKLKVDAFIADVVIPGRPPQPQVLSVRVTNAGMNSIVVNGYCFPQRDGNRMLFPEILSEFTNKRLEPGGYLSVTIPSVYLQTLSEQVDELTGFCVNDSLGKEWSLDRKRFKELQESLRKKREKN